MQISAIALWLLSADVHDFAEIRSLPTPLEGCTQTSISDGNATKLIFTICLVFLRWHHGHMLEGGGVDVSFTLVCAIFSTHPASKLHESLASSHFQFSQKQREWFSCILRIGKGCLIQANHYLRMSAKHPAHCILCLKNNPGQHSKCFPFCFPEDRKVV